MQSYGAYPRVHLSQDKHTETTIGTHFHTYGQLRFIN